MIAVKIRSCVIALASLISLAGTSEAKILASGPLYVTNGGGGALFVCRVFNAGLANVAFTSRQIISSSNTSLALSVDSCNVALAPGKYCQFYGTIVGNNAHSCRAVAIGTDTDIRGTAQAVSGSTVLGSAPMD